MRACAAARIPLFALWLASAGCSVVNSIGPTTCDRSEQANPPVLYREGTVENGVYMSSAWDGELLYFPGGMWYQIDHKLGGEPRTVQFYLSFSQHGVLADSEGKHPNALTLAAGNQAELRGIDDQSLFVANGSCAEYWLLVVASGAGENGAGGADGAGGAGGAGGGG